MTLDIVLTVAPFILAAIALIGVIWRLETRITALEKGRQADAGRLLALEGKAARQDQRIGFLELPETDRHRIRRQREAAYQQAMNAYAGHEGEGRS
jgi:hypothetical protein